MGRCECLVMRTPGSSSELEKCRRLAVQRVRAGHPQTEVVRFLGVDDRNIRQWMKAYRDEGEKGLAARPHAGPAPRLSSKQLRIVLSWLSQSPTEFGFLTELSTFPRIAKLILECFGIRFHSRSINAWLTNRGVTPKKSRRVPRERDEAKIQAWLTKDGPRILKRGSRKSPHRPHR